jgi:hypothetical protein
MPTPTPPLNLASQYACLLQSYSPEPTEPPNASQLGALPPTPTPYTITDSEPPYTPPTAGPSGYPTVAPVIVINGVGGITHGNCTATVMINWISQYGRLKGPGVIVIDGPNLRGTRTVQAANGAIQLTLTFHIGRQKREWKVSLISVNGVPTQFDTGEVGPTYTFTSLGSQFC